MKHSPRMGDLRSPIEVYTCAQNSVWLQSIDYLYAPNGSDSIQLTGESRTPPLANQPQDVLLVPRLDQTGHVQ